MWGIQLLISALVVVVLQQEAGGARLLGRLLSLRGGGGGPTLALNNATTNRGDESCAVLISTTVGSSFLDKRKRISVPKNATIADIKVQLSQKFPGSPPQELQRLFFGIRMLADNQVVGNLSSLSPIPIMLDMITGTSAYNKTMSISQALEAYASIVVQQSYIGDRLKTLFAAMQAQTTATVEGGGGGGGGAATAAAAAATTGGGGGGGGTASQEPPASVVVDTAIYREMFVAVNQSLHATYLDDIADALVEEQEPETFSADTASWRHNKKDKSPITMALAKEFDLNIRGIRNFAYYSVLLGVFALFGTNTQISSKLLIFMVPFLWVSKLRQLRLVSKLVVNLVVAMMPKFEFLMPLLPAPYQVIAVETAASMAVADKSPPVVPRPKRR